MILQIASALCLAYFFACGVRFSFKTSLLWGWTVAAAYFFTLSRLPPLPRRLLLSLFLLYLLGLALFLRKSRGRDALAPGDAILVLGSRTDGALPARYLTERAEKAASLYEASPAPVLLSGGRVGRETRPEAQALRDLLLARGVAEQELRLETGSRTSWENLAMAAPLLEGARRVTVVTHAFHRRRVLELAKRALPGKEVAFAAVPDRAGLLALHLLVRESFTFLADLLRGRAAL